MLVGAKVLVFALFCTAGTINPFITLILQDLKYTAEETGTLISLSKIVSLLLTPVLCAVADAYHCHVPLLVVVSLVAAVLMVLWWGAIPEHRVGMEPVPSWRGTTAAGARAFAGIGGNATLLGDAAQHALASAGDLIVSSLIPQGGHDQKELRRGKTAATFAVTARGSGPSSSSVSLPSTVVDLATVLTALLLGLYYTISGSKSVITDTLVMKQIDLSMSSGSGNASGGGGEPEGEALRGTSPDTTSTPVEVSTLEDRDGAPYRPRSPVLPTTPTATTAAETQEKDSAANAAYPLQRLWGSISYGCVASLTGILVKVFSGAAGRGDGKDSSHTKINVPPSGGGVEVSKAGVAARGDSKPYLTIPILHAFSLLLFAAVVVVVTRRSRPRKGPGRGGAAAVTSPTIKSLGSAKGTVTGCPARPSAGDSGPFALDREGGQPQLDRGRGTGMYPTGTTSSASSRPFPAPGVATVAASSAKQTRFRLQQQQQQQQPVAASAQPLAAVSDAESKVLAPSTPTTTSSTSSSSPLACLCSWNYLVHLHRLAAVRCRGWLSLPSTVRTTLRVYVYLLRNPNLVFPLFLGSFFLTLAEMTTWIFLFPYARRELHASPQLFSLIMLVHLASEVASFTVSSLLLQQRRVFVVFFTSAVCYSVKLYGYSVVRNPWWLLAVEVLHGPCAAFRLTAAVAHVTTCAKKAERFFTTAKHPPSSWPAAATGEDGGAGGARKKWENRCMVAVVDTQVAVVDVRGGGGAGAAGGVRSPTVSSASPPMSPTVGAAVAAAEPEQQIELLATAYSIMWFAATGLPMALTGLLPMLINALFTAPGKGEGGEKVENAAGGTSASLPMAAATRAATGPEPMELRLFRTVSLLLMIVACLFVVYNRMKMFH